MRLTLHTDYSLRVLVFLALRPSERVATQTIADAYGLSHAHLQKIVRSLGALELVSLHRGVGGGVELAVDPEEISVGAVVRALSEDTALVECFEPQTDACVISPACALKSGLKEAREAFYAVLDPLTIGSVVRGGRGRKLGPLLGR